MKTRTIVTAIIVTIFGLALGISAVQAGDPITAPTEPIIIDGKKPVKFPHATHLDMGVVCGECHHDQEHNPRTAEGIGALPDSKVLQCANCHTDDFANAELRERKNIFHINCRECHKAGFNGKKGPTNCNACHIKKARKAVEGC